MTSAHTDSQTERLTFPQIRHYVASLTADTSRLDRVMGDLAVPLAGFNRVACDPTGQEQFTQMEQQGIARAVQILLPDFGKAPNDAERQLYTDRTYQTGTANNLIARLRVAIDEVNHQIDWVVNCEQAQILNDKHPALFADLTPLSILFGQAVRYPDYVLNQYKKLSEQVMEIQAGLSHLATTDLPRDLLDKAEELERRWHAFSERDTDEALDTVDPLLLEQDGIETRLWLSIDFARNASLTIDQLMREIACKGAQLNMQGWVTNREDRASLVMDILSEAAESRFALVRSIEGNGILHTYLDAHAALN